MYNALHTDVALTDGEHDKLDCDEQLTCLIQEFVIANQNVEDHYKMSCHEAMMKVPCILSFFRSVFSWCSSTFQ
jgi:hypothetical protein